jgi:hypothetical protein
MRKGSETYPLPFLAVVEDCESGGTAADAAAAASLATTAAAAAAADVAAEATARAAAALPYAEAITAAAVEAAATASTTEGEGRGNSAQDQDTDKKQRHQERPQSRRPLGAMCARIQHAFLLPLCGPTDPIPAASGPIKLGSTAQPRAVLPEVSAPTASAVRTGTRSPSRRRSGQPWMAAGRRGGRAHRRHARLTSRGDVPGDWNRFPVCPQLEKAKVERMLPNSSLSIASDPAGESHAMV